MTTVLRIPAAIAAETLRHLRSKGAEFSEGVVLWRGTLEPPSITRIIIPAQVTSSGRFEVPLAERQRIARELAGTGKYIVAQVHSHPRAAFHSYVDDQEAIPRRPGCYSLVVPDFASRDELLEDAALFRLSSTGTWEEVAVATFAVVGEGGAHQPANPTRGGLLQWLIARAKRLGRSDT